jgi:hypothetical protein
MDMKSRVVMNRDHELKLRRRVRLYREFLAKQVHLFYSVAIFLMLYFSRNVISMVFTESVAGYAFLGRYARDLIYSVLPIVDADVEVRVGGINLLPKQYMLDLINGMRNARGGYNLEDVKAKIETIPLVKSVKIVRNIAKRSLSIDVEEKDFVGVFSFDDGNRLLGLDSSGMMHDVMEFKDLFKTFVVVKNAHDYGDCLLYTSPSPRDH